MAFGGQQASGPYEAAPVVAQKGPRLKKLGQSWLSSTEVYYIHSSTATGKIGQQEVAIAFSETSYLSLIGWEPTRSAGQIGLSQTISNRQNKTQPL